MKLSLFILLLLQLSGREFDYSVVPGDTLTRIGSRFGVDAATIAAGNGMELSSTLRVGQVLRIDNRHILPERAADEQEILIVNIAQRMLFFWTQDGLAHALPVAAGSPGWKTPLGQFTILTKEIDPVWDVPLSIQAEMLRAGKPILTRVPPSPDNPLGKYWLGLSMPGIGIHGTNAPGSIYSNVTHGCIRVHPEEIAALFESVRVGTRGRILYEPVLVFRDGDSVFIEVHPDVYRKGKDPASIIWTRAQSEGFADLLDFDRVREVVSKREGIARDVTRQRK